MMGIKSGTNILWASLFFVCMSLFCQAQTYRWSDPATTKFPVVSGRYWQAELKNPYDRLPAKAIIKVRREVWELAENSAGEYISFKTNARDIKIKYRLKKINQLQNMVFTWHNKLSG